MTHMRNCLSVLVWFVIFCQNMSWASEDHQDGPLAEANGNSEQSDSGNVEKPGKHQYKLACYYYKYQGDPKAKDFGSSQGGRIWARYLGKKYVYLSGTLEDGFFVVKEAYVANLFNRERKDISHSKESIYELCNKSISEVVGSDFKLIQVGASEYTRLGSHPIAFDDKTPRLVVFGDSFSDGGNLKALTRLFPAHPYVMGRFSNGPIWTDHLSLFSHFPVSNWAYAGAHLNSRPFFKTPLRDHVSGSTEDSVKRYISLSLPKGQLRAPDQDLFIISAGVNDYSSEIETKTSARSAAQRKNQEALTETITSSIMDRIEKLYLAGARNFIVMGLWDLGIAPRLRGPEYDQMLTDEKSKEAALYDFSSFITRLTILHNIKMKQKIAEMSKSRSDIKISFVDLFEGLNRILNQKNLTQRQGHETFDYGFRLENLVTILRGDHGGPDIHLAKRCFTGDWQGLDKAVKFVSDNDAPREKKVTAKVTGQQATCPEVRDAFFYDKVHFTTMGNCWLSYLVQKVLFEEQWISEMPELDKFKEYCLSSR